MIRKVIGFIDALEDDIPEGFITEDELHSMEDASSCVRHKEFQDPFGGCSSCFKEWEQKQPLIF